MRAHTTLSLPGRVLLCLLLLAITLGGHPGPLHAGVPVLTASSKLRPARARTATPARNKAPVVLGVPGSIAQAKRRPAGTLRGIKGMDLLGRYARRLKGRISARSVVIMDARTGEILYSRAGTRPRQPASTIKVLTGLIAIQRLKNHEKIKVSRHAASMPRSKVYLAPGKTYKANDLINAVLLASANDASVALAERIGGSEQAFARMMTRKARSLGARSTVCKTASGLTAKGQYTTARDLAAIFRQAMKNREFARRMHRTRVGTTFGRTLHNHNKALWRIHGAVAGKTGYTQAARQTYVGQFERGDAAIIVAIMGSERMWDDISSLVEFGFERHAALEAERRNRRRLAAAKSREPST